MGGDVKVYVDGKQAKSYPITDGLMDSLSPNRKLAVLKVLQSMATQKNRVRVPTFNVIF